MYSLYHEMQLPIINFLETIHSIGGGGGGHNHKRNAGL
jgi:hypothetical protein